MAQNPEMRAHAGAVTGVCRRPFYGYSGTGVNQIHDKPHFLPVYLLRKGNPDAWARAFLASFFANDPGPETMLLVLKKGFADGDPLPACFNRLSDAARARLSFEDVPDDGVDLTAYRALCARYPDHAFLFMNSHSRIGHRNWHRAFSKAWTISGSGAGSGGPGNIVGASGSWETPLPGVIAFPNPHIRTTGFLIRASTFLELSAGRVENRAACLALEAGADNLTSLIMKGGGAALIVNADGDVFPPKDWHRSRTFRLGEQEKLLIADNRSAKYHHGTNRRRRHHARASWGPDAAPPPTSVFTCLSRILWARVFHYGFRWGR